MTHNLPRRTPLRRLATIAMLALPLAATLSLRAQAAPEDELIFANGDKLTGKLTRVAGGSVVFHSDMAGDVTVPLAKVKELHTQGTYAVLKSGETIDQSRQAGTGKLDVADDKVTVAAATPQTVATRDVNFILDQATFNKEVVHKPGLLDDWNGTATLGLTYVEASQHGSTVSAGTALNRQIPTLGLFAPRYRTLIGFQETYGNLTQDAEPAAGIAASSVKTSILHANAEHDVYFSKKLFVLGTATFDHNYSLLLQLQQIYGVGIGYTVFSSAKQQLDLRVDAHYEKQQFTTPASNVNLFGSTFSEAYRRTLPFKVQFNEALQLVPSWNDPSVFSLNGSAGLALPVYHRFALNLSATDFYLTNPAPGTRDNSFQFITGLSYSFR